MAICEEADESLFCPVQGCDVWMCFEVLISCCRAISQSCAELLSPRPFLQHPTQAVSFSRAPWCREAQGVVWMDGVSQSLTVQYELSGFPGAAHMVCVCVVWDSSFSWSCGFGPSLVEMAKVRGKLRESAWGSWL